ncbi:unnamed protein product [Diatraea saccharalis]|uniref:Protein phosphatase 1 regulatory subunit 15A/B C-terminal domain-containing protein n=1 Tax=Diatraea saccharalis TaxID=40085 RepID=A0A9N9RDW7_9NEOP|nr:unnamed protein product [Diatraea saccharalis]
MRRLKMAFVEAGSVDECFEDAFTPEDFIRISNSTYIEYYGTYPIENQNLLHTAASKIKIEKVVHENTDIKILPEVPIKCKKTINETNDIPVKQTTEIKAMEDIRIVDNIEDEPCKPEVVSSCEDKLSKLKALLQEKCKKKTMNNHSSDVSSKVTMQSNDKHVKSLKPNMKVKDKCFKNPCRTTSKRKKCNLKKSIQDDLLFAQEINIDTLPSIGNSPSVNSLDRLSDTSVSFVKTTDVSNDTDDYFDEVSGRFRSTSATESEDSFQIVFSDSPKDTRMRKMSDCDSEDSFIVFEESPYSCYTSNDVFGDSDESESEYTDSEADSSDTEDVQETKLTHTLSRTMSDLTDGILYDENSLDEVDCAVRSVCDEIPNQEIKDLTVKASATNNTVKSTGLLVNEDQKKQKRKLPSKTVRFSTDPPKVHVMRVWAFAARQARAGHWERCALDRDRFKRRIADVDMAVSWVLHPKHRARIMFQRFMPSWNSLKRKELAEKKAREYEERMEKEEQQKSEAESLKREENLVTNNDSVSDNIVQVDDTEQEHINYSNGNEISNNDTRVISDVANEIENNDKDKDKMNILKCNGLVNKTEMDDKSLLNDNSLKIVLANDQQTDFTSILKSEVLSNT